MYDIIITEAGMRKPNIYSIALHVPDLQCGVQKCLYVILHAPDLDTGWSVGQLIMLYKTMSAMWTKGNISLPRLYYRPPQRSASQSCPCLTTVVEHSHFYLLLCYSCIMLPSHLGDIIVFLIGWEVVDGTPHLLVAPGVPGKNNSVGIFNSKPFSHPIASV